VSSYSTKQQTLLSTHFDEKTSIYRKLQVFLKTQKIILCDLEIPPGETYFKGLFLVALLTLSNRKKNTKVLDFNRCIGIDYNISLLNDGL